MIQCTLLLILTIAISTNTLNIGHARQNISEEIYNMFGNLTPDHLGISNFSYERPSGFSISSMPSINTSNNSITNTQ